jgi:hypothetical protein
VYGFLPVSENLMKPPQSPGDAALDVTQIAVGQMPTQAVLKRWLLESSQTSSSAGENGSEAKNRRNYHGSIDCRPFAA